MSTSLDHIGVYVSDQRWDDIKQAINQADFETISQIDKSILVMVLAFYGLKEFVGLLITKGADLNYQYTGDERSRYAYGLEFGTTPLTQTILGSEAKHPTFGTMELLLHHGANPNQIGYSSHTPLQLAIMKDRPEHTVLLLLHGADPYLPSIDINNPNAFDHASDHPWAKKLLERLRPEFNTPTSG